MPADKLVKSKEGRKSENPLWGNFRFQMDGRWVTPELHTYRIVMEEEYKLLKFLVISNTLPENINDYS